MLTFPFGAFCAIFACGEENGDTAGNPFFTAPGGPGMLLAAAVLRGQCVLGSRQTASAGDVLCGPGGMELALPAGCTLCYAVLSGGAAEEMARALSGRASPALVAASAAIAPAALLARLHENAGRTAPGAESALCYQLVCALADALSHKTALPPLAAAAMAEISAHYHELYGVDELAETLGVSKCHLIRVFTAAVGMSPGRHLALARVEAAKRLLPEGGYTLAVIATLCGFSGANYLCRVFKRETGLTPKEWRAAAAPAGTASPGAPEQEMYL